MAPGNRITWHLGKGEVTLPACLQRREQAREGLAEVREPGWSGEERATALPCYGVASERKRAGGQDTAGGRWGKEKGPAHSVVSSGGEVGGWQQSQGMKALQRLVHSSQSGKGKNQSAFLTLDPCQV